MKIVTSLSFRGECREAFEFHARVLGGEITAAMRYGDGPPDMPIGPEYKDWLMHCWLQVGDQALMGSDSPPEFAPPIDQLKNGFDVTLHTDDPAEARRPGRGRSADHAILGDLLVTRLRRTDRQVRRAVDGQYHPGRGLRAV